MTDAALPAVILAGGRALRLGGGDKCLLPMGDRRIVDHILASLSGQASAVAINANGDPGRFAGYGVSVLGDGMPGFPGPLAGILAAMDWAATLGADRVLTVAGDTPFLPRNLMYALADQARPNRPCIAATRLPTGVLLPQPTIGLWPLTLRHNLRADLHDGMRKVRRWAEAQKATLVPFDDGERLFFNINTPDDLIAAQAMCPAQSDPMHEG